MATIKSYTDLKQSKKLAEILPFESADMYYPWDIDSKSFLSIPIIKDDSYYVQGSIDCWSLTALLKYLSEIKPQIYTPTLFPSEGKWILHFVEYGRGIVCGVSCDNPVDACVAMIEKLHELNLL